VSRLKRVRYGCIFLPKSVSLGKWGELSQKELDDLTDLVELPRRKVGTKTQDEKISEQRQQAKMKPRQQAKSKPRQSARHSQGGTPSTRRR
jgi:23S rRNA pseudouridine2605 synthase